jgi:hypothetical protein
MVTSIIRDILMSVVAILAIIGICFLIGQRRCQNQATECEVERVDTLYICDTIVQYKPIVEERVVIERVPFKVVDTLWMRDTFYIELDREQLIWKDSLSTIFASGFRPQIDSVHHYVKERVITRELTEIVKKPCRWGVGIQAGYGICVSDGIRTAPYVGIGVSYNLLSW